MKKKYRNEIVRRAFPLFLLLCMFLPALSGCGVQPPAQEETQLWIVTEQTTWDRMNGQTQVVIEAFEEAHTDVSVRLDILPVDEQERSVYLQQLRTQILQGGGPDGYLLPTDNHLILDEPVQYTHVEVEPLFVDVELAMRNGLFYDIGSFYDADDTLGKEGLNTRIMDAGVADGARYVLPLRYDMPVIYGEAEAMAEAGLDASVLAGDIGTVMDAVLALGDPVLAGGILYDGFSAFADFIDYGSGNAILEETTLARYLKTYQQLQALVTDHTVLMEKLNLRTYIFGLYGKQKTEEEPESNIIYIGGQPIEEETVNIQTEYYPLYIGSMTDALAYAPFAKYEDAELTMVPMRSVGGDVVATVTYYAAVGSGCREPELTYEFLRQFLLEESQWELNRPERRHPQGDQTNTSNDLQYPGLIENGWPVRAAGSVEHLWRIRRRQIYVHYTRGETRTRMRMICLSELEDGRIPVLAADINQVRFNTTMSEDLAGVLAQLNDTDNANRPTQADVQALAQRLICDLRWHVSEG